MQPIPKRCGACDACRYVQDTQRILMADAHKIGTRPVAVFANRDIDMWNTVLRENPCQVRGEQ